MGRPHNIYRKRPQNVGRGRALALHIGKYQDVLWRLHQDVLRTLYFNVLRTSVEYVLGKSVGDALWHYIKNHMGTSIERLFGTCSGRPRDVTLLSGLFFCLLPGKKKELSDINRRVQYSIKIGKEIYELLGKIISVSDQCTKDSLHALLENISTRLLFSVIVSHTAKYGEK